MKDTLLISPILRNAPPDRHFLLTSTEWDRLSERFQGKTTIRGCR